MKLISEIKLKTKSLKDKRKNILKLIECFEGKLEPDCPYTYNRYEIYKDFDDHWKEVALRVSESECEELTKQIDIIGKSILELRGNKWNF